MQAFRSVVAVAAGLGFMLTGAMVGTSLSGALLLAAGMPDAYIAVSLVISALVGVLGGWLTARIGGRQEFQHAAALAALFAVLTVIAVSSAPAQGQPAWYAPVVGALGVAGVLVGGWLRASAAEAARP